MSAASDVLHKRVMLTVVLQLNSKVIHFRTYTGWTKSRFTVVSTRSPEFIFVLLFIYQLFYYLFVLFVLLLLLLIELL
jgi:hypothetical protein